MDNDEELNSPPGLYPSPCNVMTTTVAPNHFLLSTYKENHRTNGDSHLDYHNRSVTGVLHSTHRAGPSCSYKCCLCRKMVDDATLTCAKCVNTGRFCPSRHDNCSNKRRQMLASLLNTSDQDEFHQHSNKFSINTPAHFQ